VRRDKGVLCLSYKRVMSKWSRFDLFLSLSLIQLKVTLGRTPNGSSSLSSAVSARDHMIRKFRLGIFFATSTFQFTVDYQSGSHSLK